MPRTDRLDRIARVSGRLGYGPALSAFKTPRPNHLPISAALWDTAQSFDQGGPTVIAALCEAVVQLEPPYLQ